MWEQYYKRLALVLHPILGYCREWVELQLSFQSIHICMAEAGGTIIKLAVILFGAAAVVVVIIIALVAPRRLAVLEVRVV
jgi:hypothetical protein